MKTNLLSITAALFFLSQSVCSIYKASRQPPPANLDGISIGTPRQDLIMRLGATKFSDTDPEGRKQDSFEFSSGFHSASKAHVILYVAADVVTLALAELILWPLELTVMDKATCNGYAVYDGSHMVVEWRVLQKAGIQDC
jgi:hypothetical protein